MIYLNKGYLMNFKSFTDELIKDIIRVFFWIFIIVGNIYFWFDINLFQYFTPFWLK